MLKIILLFFLAALGAYFLFRKKKVPVAVLPTPEKWKKILQDMANSPFSFLPTGKAVSG